jgi:serine/threonine protein kinase
MRIETLKNMKVIGEGNFSSVYRGIGPTGNPVAVKKVKKSTKDKTSYEIAKREAEILTKLHSPSVISLLGTQ